MKKIILSTFLFTGLFAGFTNEMLNAEQQRIEAEQKAKQIVKKKSEENTQIDIENYKKQQQQEYNEALKNIQPQGEESRIRPRKIKIRTIDRNNN